MKKRLLALAVTAVLAVSATGCVKVVKIGEEGALTGKVEFNAGDSVSGLWEEAKVNIEEKAVELPAFLQEAGGDLKSLADKYGEVFHGNFRKHQLRGERDRCS